MCSSGSEPAVRPRAAFLPAPRGSERAVSGRPLRRLSGTIATRTSAVGAAFRPTVRGGQAAGETPAGGRQLPGAISVLLRLHSRAISVLLRLLGGDIRTAETTRGRYSYC